MTAGIVIAFVGFSLAVSLTIFVAVIKDKLKKKVPNPEIEVIEKTYETYPVVTVRYTGIKIIFDDVGTFLRHCEREKLDAVYAYEHSDTIEYFFIKRDTLGTILYGLKLDKQIEAEEN